MPTFDFQCQDCNHVFEFSRPFGSTEMPLCAACKSTNVLKLLAPPNIQFKGSGFYKTDAITAPKAEKADSNTTKQSDSQPKSSPEPKKE